MYLDHLAESGLVPWNEGGKESFLASRGMTMSHDELVSEIGAAAYQKITEAGFVLVPKRWKDDVFKHLKQCGPKWCGGPECQVRSSRTTSGLKRLRAQSGGA